MHKTQRVKLYDGTILPEIDRGIAHVVRLLNRPGLWTLMSCQGDDIDSLGCFAEVGINGPLARPFVRSLLEDQLDRPSKHVEFLRVSAYPDSIVVGWNPCEKQSVTARFKRVLGKLDA